MFQNCLSILSLPFQDYAINSKNYNHLEKDNIYIKKKILSQKYYI